MRLVLVALLLLNDVEVVVSYCFVHKLAYDYAQIVGVFIEVARL